MIDAHAHPSENTNVSHERYVACCRESDWTVWLSRQTEQLKVGIGIHPWYVENERLSIPLLRRHLLSHPDAFVGEIGLDRSRRYKSTYEKQKKYFAEQLALAVELDRPVCIHLVRSYQDGYSFLKTHRCRSVYFHGFLGSVEEARRYPNAYFGFNRRNIAHSKGIRILKELSEKQILLESDGDSNRDSLEETLQQIARIRKKSLHDMEQIVDGNAKRWVAQS